MCCCYTLCCCLLYFLSACSDISIAFRLRFHLSCLYLASVYYARISYSLSVFSQVGLHELCYLLLGEQLYFSSAGTARVPTFLPWLRTRTTKSMAALENMDEDDEDVFTVSVIERYVRRPAGEPWESMSLHAFCEWFSNEFVRKAGVDENQPGEEDGEEDHEQAASEDEGIRASKRGKKARVNTGVENPAWRERTNRTTPPFLPGEGEKVQPRFTLQAPLARQVIRQRATPRCVTAVTSSAVSVNSVYALMLMHCAFRDEYADLLGAPECELSRDTVTLEYLERRAILLYEKIAPNVSKMHDDYRERIEALMLSLTESFIPHAQLLGGGGGVGEDVMSVEQRVKYLLETFFRMDDDDHRVRKAISAQMMRSTMMVMERREVLALIAVWPLIVRR